MKVNTALSFLCLGAALWLASDDERQRSRRILGFLVAIIAGATLSEYAFHANFGIDQFLFRDTRSPSLSAYPGRMAISTAICFLFLGSAIMFLGSRKALPVRHVLVATTFAFSLVALCGYLYGVKSLYSITSFSTIGVHTSAGLMAVCVAYFLACPNEGIVAIAASDTNAGVVLRRLVPTIVVVPILIGGLVLAGQRTGLYDTPFGISLLVLGSIGCLTVLALLTARSTHCLEGERFQAVALLESREELLRIFVKSVPAGVAMFDRDMRYVQVSDRWCADYHVESCQVLGRSHYELFPDIPDRWKEVHRRALAGETLRADEDRWDREGGTTWVRWEVRPWRNLDGSLGGLLVFAEEITRRKQMEEALSDMSRKLIESQEQERARIGRELHDDIGQRLAMLAVELEQLQESPSGAQSRLPELRKELVQISDDVQALSHDLHSSKLEYLGAVAGMKSWCKEFGERQKFEVDFKSDVSSVLPSDLGIGLFRVLQEAMHNAVKHSGVRRIEVQLSQDASEVHLIISDQGVGFDVQEAMQRSGLGLVSMRERVRLLNGTIAIESKPLHGTTIRVRVPLPSENGSALTG